MDFVLGYFCRLVLDSAPWHTTQKLVVPENIKLLPLPPYSPELNLTEHIWDYIREQKQFNNHIFESLDDVEAQLVGLMSCCLYGRCLNRDRKG